MRRTMTEDALAALGLACLAPALAGAQDWQPTRPIKLICPFPAGGGTDLIARIVAQQLSDAARPAGLCREPRRRQRRRSARWKWRGRSPTATRSARSPTRR